MNTNDKVLVAYASKYGATTEIAEKIGDVLRQSGLDVVVLPADVAGDIEMYSAVVLGSGVYAGHWLKQAAAFLEDNESALWERPVWLFSSGPTGEGDPVEVLDGWRFPDNLRPIAERIKPRDMAVFGGKIDVSALHLGDKLIIKAVKAKTGDFRDWRAIEAWAGRIAEQIAAAQPAPSG
jgi:menaquinone-dependent protoporphyrinogen oxidase